MMNDEILATYQAADEILRLMMGASGYATQYPELTTVVTWSDDPQDLARAVSEARSRLSQRHHELKNLECDIRGVTERLGGHWQQLQPIRDYSFADTGPFVVGQLLTVTIPAVQRWIRETCGWLALADQYPVLMTQESKSLCDKTADGFPLSCDEQGHLHQRLLREKSILLKNIVGAAAARVTAGIHDGKRNRENDISTVTAKQLAAHAICGDRLVRNALEAIKPTVEASGRNGGHQWQYCKAVEELRKMKTGKLVGVIWPDSAAELSVPKHSSKIPAKRLRR